MTSFVRHIATFLLVVAAGPSWAICNEETAAYNTAKEAFVSEVESIYHTTINGPNLRYRVSGQMSLNVENLPPDLAELKKYSDASMQVIWEMGEMWDPMIEAVSPLFLRRRSLPSAFTTGADLSRCLAERENTIARSVFHRMETKRPEPQQGDLLSDPAVREHHAGAIEEIEEHEQLVSDLVDQRDRASDPQEVESLNQQIGVATMLISTSYLNIAAEELIEPLVKETPKVMGNTLIVSMTVGVSMSERDRLRDKIVARSNQELNFGEFYVDTDKQ